MRERNQLIQLESWAKKNLNKNPEVVELNPQKVKFGNRKQSKVLIKQRTESYGAE